MLNFPQRKRGLTGILGIEDTLVKPIEDGLKKLDHFNESQERGGKRRACVSVVTNNN